MTIEPTSLDPTVQAFNAQASTLMKRGIRLLNETGPEAAGAALLCFDRALKLRLQLPFETAPRLRYGLAACWLSRADALMRLGEAHQIVAAVAAFDAAVVLLRGLPLTADPRYPRRLAIAHQNRGLALHAQGAPARLAAIAAFTDAIAVLDHEAAAGIGDRRYLQAAVWVNLANVWVSDDAVTSGALARDAARRAIALVAELEAHDLDAAEVGLRARHVFCQALATDLSSNVGTMSDNVHDATDMVDDGLNLVRQWKSEGGRRLGHLADDLFRFGARVYALYQPHFLGEFLSENLDRRA